jgi:hypothetical protein
MTKAEELNAVKNFTASLPTDSYLRPWLESVLPEIEADIRSDFPVSPSFKLARVECDRIVNDTRRHCDGVRQRAEQEAAHIIAQARKEADGIRHRLFNDLRGFVATLGFSL